MDPARLIAKCRYKPGWAFKLGGPLNRYLCIHATTIDSITRARQRNTQHMFEIPADLSEREFARWAFDRLLDCERHETAEFFEFGGQKPFFPHHQDEGSPYEHVEHWET